MSNQEQQKPVEGPATARLSKLMSQQGICSRREADKFIEQGMVYVNGEKVTTLGTKVAMDAVITLNNKARNAQAELATVLLNKPMDYVSGLPEDGYTSAVMLINQENRQNSGDKVPNRKGLAPAGRLDIDSMGLIVFTQDGRIAKQLIGPENNVEKEYLVWAKGEINQDKLKLLRHGLSLDGQNLRPAKVDHLKGSQMRFTLLEGKKRQIRRMCESVDLEVSRLIRVRIGNIKLGDLENGKWRLLRSNERF